jgi:NAD(P)H-dependent flavin oxidoreductase YrpB (nitropropane dioxygenase family)
MVSAGLRDLLGIDLPIVLGALGGVSSVALAATVSESGGLGSHGLYGHSAERIRETMEQLRAETSRPFLLNLWLPFDDTPDGVGVNTYSSDLLSKIDAHLRIGEVNLPYLNASSCATGKPADRNTATASGASVQRHPPPALIAPR